MQWSINEESPDKFGLKLFAIGILLFLTSTGTHSIQFLLLVLRLDLLEAAHQGLVHAHHSAVIVELAAIVGC